MNASLILNDWQTGEAYGAPTDETPVYTDNPWLWESLGRSQNDVRTPADLLVTGDHRAIADQAWRVSEAWRTFLDDDRLSRESGLGFGRALGQFLFYFVNVALLRALQLKKIIAAHGSAIIPYFSDDPENDPDGDVDMLFPMNCNYFAWLARAGGFANCHLQALSGTFAATSAKHMICRPLPSLRERALLAALRLTSVKNYPFSKVFVRRTRRCQVSGAKSVWSFIDYEPIFPVMTHLRLRGYRLGEISLPPLAPVAASQDLVLKLAAQLSRAASQAVVDADGAVIDAMARRVAQFVLSRLVAAAAAARSAIEDKFPEGSETALVLSNGVAEPAEIFVEQQVRAQGKAFVVFAHGGIGLLEGYRRYVHHSDMEYCSAYVAHNDYEISYYKKMASNMEKPAVSGGVAAAVRPPCRRLARILGRKTLRVSRDERLIVYCPTRFREDCVLPEFEAADVPYWRFMKSLVWDGFAKSSGSYVVKFHQKGLSPDGSGKYAARRHPLEAGELPRNVRCIAYPQLNYIRWAADILVVDRATSTLQWALSHEVPLVYLDIPMDPLTEEARAALSKGAFLIDACGQDWQEAVREFLRRPQDEIHREWEAKRTARQHFFDHYLIGTKRSVSEVVSWIETEGAHAG